MLLQTLHQFVSVISIRTGIKLAFADIDVDGEKVPI